jgi:nucleotide-binding universal stress UspA family protein
MAMNTTPSVREDRTQLVREHEVPVTGTSAPVHGVTHYDGKLVLASGEYLFRLRTDNGRLVDHLQTFPIPGGLAYDGTYLWQRGSRGVEQVDTRTGAVVRAVTPELPDLVGIECMQGDLLLLYRGGRALTRLHIEDHALGTRDVVVSDVATEVPLRGLAWDGGELWSATDGSLVRIDPSSARVIARLPVSGMAQVYDLAADAEGRFWCVDGSSRKVRCFARRGEAEKERRSLSHPQGPPSGGVVDLSTVPRSSKPPEVKAPAEVAGPTFGRILVPVDFGPGSRRAVATALVMQEQLGSEVHLLHVAEQGGNDEFLAGIGGGNLPPTELVADGKDRLRRFVDDLFPGKMEKVVVHASVGGNVDVVESVERLAKKITPSLVILAGRPRRTLFRTHIERITRDVDAAVMVLWVQEEVPSA